MFRSVRAWATRLSRPGGIAAAAAALIGIGIIAAASAAGDPAPATPTITGAPSNPTTSTSASFTFTDSTSGATFQCALDSSSYTPCTSPKTYTGLALGTHTFNVRAYVSNGNKTSAAASYTWGLLAAPPAPTITSKPANPSNQSSATFAFTDTMAGVSYLCALDSPTFTACTSPKTYTGLAGGSHTFAVEATDGAGHTSAATSYGWLIDLTPPPAPAITSAPDDPTTDTTASFAFTDSESGVNFRCGLDGAAPSACASPKSYTNLSYATHTFVVQAVDAAGNVSAATSKTWTIQQQVASVPISGDVTGLLYPGASALLNVKISNPYHFDILVNQLTVTVSNATTKNGQPNPSCSGTANLVVAHQFSGAAFKVKDSRTVTLADLGIPQSQWPTLRMPDLPTNQDACKGTTFNFTYSATITKANV